MPRVGWFKFDIFMSAVDRRKITINIIPFRGWGTGLGLKARNEGVQMVKAITVRTIFFLQGAKNLVIDAGHENLSNKAGGGRTFHTESAFGDFKLSSCCMIHSKTCIGGEKTRKPGVK
jgi:hypothetical protein